MQRWEGKIAVVTGASAGVGAAVSVELANQGLTVVAVARRVEKIEALKSKVSQNTKGKIVPIKGDVSKEEEVKNIFEFVKKSYGTVHVLINNAGFLISGTFIDGEPSDWKKTLDVNVIGLATCAKEAIKLMRSSGVNDGHIINVNSVAGHRIPPVENPTFNIYPPSKFAVTAISETLRNELRHIGSKIRVTNLSPGYIKTEFEEVAVQKASQAIREDYSKFLGQIPPMYAEDLAQTVTHILSAPPHVQITELGMIGI